MGIRLGVTTHLVQAGPGERGGPERRTPGHLWLQVELALQRVPRQRLPEPILWGRRNGGRGEATVSFSFPTAAEAIDRGGPPTHLLVVGVRRHGGRRARKHPGALPLPVLPAAPRPLCAAPHSSRVHTARERDLLFVHLAPNLAPQKFFLSLSFGPRAGRRAARRRQGRRGRQKRFLRRPFGTKEPAAAKTRSRSWL
jgi:hypothetical protein